MPITTQPQKLQQTSDELGDEAKNLLITFPNINTLKLKQINFVVEQTDASSSNSMLLGHPTNGIMGVANGLGGSQIVMGPTSGSTTVELIRRRYDWSSKGELEQGNKSPNINISQGFVQLGNVTIKGISLDHKENKNN